jgi:hypothetical protein
VHTYTGKKNVDESDSDYEDSRTRKRKSKKSVKTSATINLISTESDDKEVIIITPTAKHSTSTTPEPDPNLLVECHICQKQFHGKLAKRMLETHLETHSRVNQNKCSQCPSKFTTNEALAEHVRLEHVKLKQFSCTFCRKHLASTLQKDIHEKVHSSLSFIIQLSFQFYSIPNQSKIVFFYY